MIRAMGCRLLTGVVVFSCFLVPSALEAQQVYELSPDAFVCRQSRDFVIFDQLMEAGDTAAAREYARGRCLFLATERRLEWLYGDPDTMDPERRAIARILREVSKEHGSYWPSDKSAYVLVRDLVPPGLLSQDQQRERTRPDPLEATFVPIRTIGGEPLFEGWRPREMWVRSADLTPLG